MRHFFRAPSRVNRLLGACIAVGFAAFAASQSDSSLISRINDNGLVGPVTLTYTVDKQVLLSTEDFRKEVESRVQETIQQWRAAGRSEEELEFDAEELREALGKRESKLKIEFAVDEKRIWFSRDNLSSLTPSGRTNKARLLFDRGWGYRLVEGTEMLGGALFVSEGLPYDAIDQFPLFGAKVVGTPFVKNRDGDAEETLANDKRIPVDAFWPGSTQDAFCTYVKGYLTPTFIEGEALIGAIDYFLSDTPVFRLMLSDYRKIEGAWVAHKAVFERFHFDAEGKPTGGLYERTTYRLTSAKSGFPAVSPRTFVDWMRIRDPMRVTLKSGEKLSMAFDTKNPEVMKWFPDDGLWARFGAQSVFAIGVASLCWVGLGIFRSYRSGKRSAS